MSNGWLQFVLVVVLVLDFTENEQPSAVGYFSHRLFTPLQREFANAIRKFIWQSV